MGMPVRIDEELYAQAKSEAVAEHRTIAGQIEFWSTLGRTSLDNPDLPVSFIAESLISMRNCATAPPLCAQPSRMSMKVQTRRFGRQYKLHNNVAEDVIGLFNCHCNPKIGERKKRGIWQNYACINFIVRASFICLGTRWTMRSGWFILRQLVRMRTFTAI